MKVRLQTSRRGESNSYTRFRCEQFFSKTRLVKVTPYSYLARGDWVLKWRERAQFSI